MELKKFEGTAGFLQLEKDLILRAMEDSKNVDPGLAARGVEQAESRRTQIESEIEILQSEWKQQLELVRQESERVLGEDEVKEFKTRIAVLLQELDVKNIEIQRVNEEKRAIEETVDRALNIEIDLKDQTEEIGLLNARYSKALKDKI
jgi:hypothetical protein